MFSAYALRVIMFGPTASPVVHRHSTWHIGTTDTGITATPVSASAAPVNGSRSIDVAIPSTPTASWRVRIDAASFFRGHRTAGAYSRGMAATVMDGRALAERIRATVAEEVRVLGELALATVL